MVNDLSQKIKKLLSRKIIDINIVYRNYKIQNKWYQVYQDSREIKQIN